MAGALLARVRSQPSAIETLRRALTSGRVHHAYLFAGPAGVGKELAAFGLAQALVCETRKAGSAEACGVCSSCHRAFPRPGEARPTHPDVVVLERGLYDPAAIGRRSPEAQEISIDQVRALVLGRSSFAPYEGHAKVFIVRRAEELSPSASNALLKTLEEPGKLTHFVLLTSSPDSMLPTIVSRTQRVRFGVLPDALVAELLTERGVDAGRAAEIASLAGGSMASALALSDPEQTARREDFLSRTAAALQASHLGPSLEIAEEAKKGDKQEVVHLLEAFAARLAAEARTACTSPDRRADVAIARHGLAMTALEQVETSLSTQLALEAMLLKMRAL